MSGFEIFSRPFFLVLSTYAIFAQGLCIVSKMATFLKSKGVKLFVIHNGAKSWVLFYSVKYKDVFKTLFGKVRCMEWQKLAFFVHCFVSECLANQPTTVLELCLSVVLFEVNRVIWQDFFAFLWFILPEATFPVNSYILLSWNKENLFLKYHIITKCVA